MKKNLQVLFFFFLNTSFHKKLSELSSFFKFGQFKIEGLAFATPPPGGYVEELRRTPTFKNKKRFNLKIENPLPPP